MAQRFNCSALLIYSDPADYAPPGVPVYPDGPSLPLYGVQRGSLLVPDGDPLTPGVPAVGKLLFVVMIIMYIFHVRTSLILIECNVQTNQLMAFRTCTYYICVNNYLLVHVHWTCVEI